MAAPLSSLVDAFRQIDDRRKARGIRHPFSSILTLTFLYASTIYTSGHSGARFGRRSHFPFDGDLFSIVG
jgi:hypothetical protein